MHAPRQNRIPRELPGRGARVASALPGSLRFPLGGALFAMLLLTGCLRDLAIDGLAGALASSGDVFASDEDPELVREALPFALKTMEALLAESPENEELLLATSSGFTQYAAGFIEADARELAEVDYERHVRARDRALRLYLRARDYGLRGLELRHPGLGARLRAQPASAASEVALADLPLAYWTAAAWGSAIALGLNRPEIVADVDAVRALLARAATLDESWSDGAIHEALIVIEALPEMMGGSPARALEHYARAVELSGGTSASAHVLVAENVFVPAQDRAAFERALETALAVDPDAVPARRLENTLARERARWLLDHADDLILADLEDE